MDELDHSRISWIIPAVVDLFFKTVLLMNDNAYYEFCQYFWELCVRVAILLTTVCREKKKEQSGIPCPRDELWKTERGTIFLCHSKVYKTCFFFREETVFCGVERMLT